MNGICKLREIEMLGWDITASVNLQYELLNILFSSFFDHLRGELHSHHTDVPARPLTLLEEPRLTHLAGD